MILRKVFASLFLFTVAGFICFLFWEMELVYLKPTPVPDNYKEVYVDQVISVGDTLESDLGRPVFYHFFTTKCPCSKFNLDHFNALKRNYSDKIDFVVVIPAEDDISDALPFFEGETKILKDTLGQLALNTGVYSTPQAVIINTDHRLYFRGNYNKARYCTDPFSNFAQMAVDSLLLGRSSPEFGPLASIAYGCGIN